MAFNAEAMNGFTQNLTVLTRGMTDEAAVRAMVSTAIAERTRVLGGSPTPTGYRQIVDGIEGAALERVRPDGVIIFAWAYFGEGVKAILRLFVEGAPFLTGNYRNSILVLVDGVDATTDDINGDTKQVIIVPSAIYARRLERGRVHDRAKTVTRRWAHNVERTVGIARRLYGDLVHIEFNYIELVGAYQLKAPSSLRKRRGSLVTEMTYPALIVTPRMA